MAEGRIFISYRRGLDQHAAGRLFGELATEFSPDKIFMDVDAIPPGVDFVEYLGDQVSKCDAFVAVVGPGWIDTRERLDNPNDFVRIEIESALKRADVRIIPVLIDGASMPEPADLPESMQPFARRAGVLVGHENFGAVVKGRLTRALRDAFEAAPKTVPKDKKPAAAADRKVAMATKVERAKEPGGLSGKAKPPTAPPEPKRRVQPEPSRPINFVGAEKMSPVMNKPADAKPAAHKPAPTAKTVKVKKPAPPAAPTKPRQRPSELHRKSAATKPALSDLPIKIADTGFYRGYSASVARTSSVIIGLLAIWCIVLTGEAESVLFSWNSTIHTQFAAWFIWLGAACVIVGIGLALWPVTGRLRLGANGEEPEFSNFSWFSMVFGAGVSLGILTWAVGEPLAHLQNNPAVIRGDTTALDANNVREAYIWSYLHWGLGAWACYALIGLSMAFFCYRRGLPLTIRSALTPLFGKSLSGALGHFIDILAVVLTVLGILQMLGFGVEQFVAGLARLGIGGLTVGDGSPSPLGLVISLVIIMGAALLSALSGIGKGVKWFANFNMLLSIFLLGIFILFGATFFGATAFFVGIFDYLIALPALSFNVYSSDGVDGSEAFLQAQWQGWWTVFYWTWWIAFAPSVGLFLARISRGRSIREFVLGAMIAPSLMCFVWFAWVGGAAIDLELNGDAGGAILNAANGDKIFAMTEFMLAPIAEVLAWGAALVIVVLLMTFLVTSIDSALLIVDTINAAGEEVRVSRPHILYWGVALTLVAGGLQLSGGVWAIQTAMIIGALPFSIVMALIGAAFIKAIFSDDRRGLATPAAPGPSVAPGK